MINLRKLASLAPSTRRRKIAQLLKQIELDVMAGKMPDIPYIKGVFDIAAHDPKLPEDTKTLALQAVDALSAGNGDPLRLANSVRHGILRFLGTEPAEWDLTALADDSGGDVRIVKPFHVYLDDVRSPFNVGSIFRTAESFGVSRILCSSETASPEHKRARRTSMGCVDRIPWRISALEDLPGPLFALECGGEDIADFTFPESGTVIIGSEELGVSPEALKRADADGGRVTIPMFGNKGSLNVSVAFGILMHSWYQAVSESSSRS